jgi:hypothetical protein
MMRSLLIVIFAGYAAGHPRCDPGVCSGGATGNISVNFPSTCPTDSLTTFAGAKAVTDCQCNPGFFGTILDPGSRCAACAPGTFSSAPGATACDLCPAGSYCANASLPPKACDPKFVCPAGSVGQSNCPSGFFCPTPDLNLTCAQGSFCPSGSTAPTPCAQGSYCPNATLQIQCPAGSACPQNSTEPTPCPLGQLCSPGSAAPTPCPEGAFCANSSAMSQCPAGSFCGYGSTEPTRCPGDSVSPPAAVSYLDCSCPPGTFGWVSNATAALCEACPVNQFCLGRAVPCECAR